MGVDREELKIRLAGWAFEYGGGKYENIGYSNRNLLQTLIEHGGFVPSSGGYKPIPIRSAADEIESIVKRMEAEGWFKHGRVLRCDNFMANAPIEVRLKALQNIGVRLSRASYFNVLAAAEAYVAGAIGQGTTHSSPAAV